MAQVKDPVCGMTVDSSQAAARVDYQGETYQFCSKSCGQRFEASPRTFLPVKSSRPESTCCHGDEPLQTITGPPTPLSAEAAHTCPMHPEVRQTGPGSCPKCGMALELELPAVAVQRVEYTCPMHPEIVRDHPDNCPMCGMALELTTLVAEEANPELADMSRRLWISAALTLPLIVLAMSRMFVGSQLHAWLPGRTL
ncbi:MAG TPA: heavy metal-binding domain-containing protein [Lacipirellulaceae bacterium]|nr:heavy metal-binding domain-containing protein [Lacipirellulaceae bacterium]